MPSPRDEFAHYCCELLTQALGRPCALRRMFGGHGLSAEGLMFAFIADQTLYLKTDDESRAHWLAAGCQPFLYEARGKTVHLRYHTAPAEALDSPPAMAPWAQSAWACAVRAQARAARKPARPRARKG